MQTLKNDEKINDVKKNINMQGIGERCDMARPVYFPSFHLQFALHIESKFSIFILLLTKFQWQLLPNSWNWKFNFPDIAKHTHTGYTIAF